MTILPSTPELSIIPIVNGNGHNGRALIFEEEDSDDEIEFVLPKGAVSCLETFVQSRQTKLQLESSPVCDEQQSSLLGRLDRHELTIIERRRCSPVAQQTPQPGSNFSPLVTACNGNGSCVPSPASHGTDSCSETEDMEPLPDFCEPFEKPANVAAASVGRPNGTPPAHSSQKPLVRKRRTRKTISPDDPAEALTEMSVRGLNLFRYATVNGGLYECVECSKEGTQKTFKNKYSFQRHAFLYHEGHQRKVFPCPVCNKEFSRPDKMKNHWRMTHGGTPVFEGKTEPVTSTHSAGLLPNQSMDLVQFQLHLQQQHQLQQQQQQQKQQQHHHQQQNTTDSEQQTQEALDKRRQQEQDVLKIRQAVNAITLRQLQQIRFYQQDKDPQPDQRQPRQQQASQPAVELLGQRTISNRQPSLECSLPSQQLLVLGGAMGSE